MSNIGLPMTHFKRLRDDDIIDDISFRTIPRYKTSGLSGDGWRTSVLVELKRKGTIIYSRSYQCMSDAAAHLPWLLKTWCELSDEAIPNWIEQIKKDKRLCHQAGCAEVGESVVKLRKQYSKQGELLAQSGESYRTFCSEHENRGGASLEDSNSNYETRRA